MVAIRQLKEKLGIEVEESDIDGETIDDNYALAAADFIETKPGEHGYFIPAEYKPLVKLQLKHIESTLANSNTDMQTDYNTARDHLHTMIELVADAAATCLHFASNADDPRGYFTTFNDLIKTHREFVQDLLETQKIYKEINGEIQQANKVVQHNTQINNYTGSTSDIIKMLRDAKQQSDEVISNIIPEGE